MLTMLWIFYYQIKSVRSISKLYILANVSHFYTLKMIEYMPVIALNSIN